MAIRSRPRPRPHPLERLSWMERRQWQRDRRRVNRAYEADQLRILRRVAATEGRVYSVVPVAPAPAPTASSVSRPDPTPASVSAAIPSPPAPLPSPLALPIPSSASRAQARAIELTVGERHLVGRISVDAEADLAAALVQGPVYLVDVGRYGPFWTFAFQWDSAYLVVLASGVTLLPGTQGDNGDEDSNLVPALQAT
jgi:hypothetical protein